MREHMLDFDKTLRAPRNMNIENACEKNKDDVLPRSPPLFGRGLRYAAPARKMSPRHPTCMACRIESSYPKQKMAAGSQTRLSTLSKRRPSSPNTSLAAQIAQKLLILIHASQRFSNAQKAPRRMNNANVMQNDL